MLLWVQRFCNFSSFLQIDPTYFTFLIKTPFLIRRKQKRLQETNINDLRYFYVFRRANKAREDLFQINEISFSLSIHNYVHISNL